MSKFPERSKTAATPAPLGNPLDGVDAAFHAHDDCARREEIGDAPVLLLLADSLILLDGERTTERTFTPRIVHALRSLAHGPVALYGLLYRRTEKPIDDKTRESMQVFRALFARTEASLGDHLEDEPLREALRPLLTLSLELLTQVETARTIPGAVLASFARDCGPLVLRATDHATRLQLAALDACFLSLFDTIEEERRQALEIVIAGEHQARTRSLGMQYFRARAGEKPGEEKRLAYGEGIASMDDALTLVATRRADRALAGAFFGDPRRLQEDVLGDSAAALLQELALPALL